MSRTKTGNIQKRGRRSWRIRYYDAAGERQQETIKGDRETAERELAIRLGELAKGVPVSSRPNTVLFEELAADVLTDYEVNEYSTYDTQEARYRLHILPHFGRRKAAQITTAQLSAYIVIRRNEGATNGTIKRELELVRHTFRLAIDGRRLLIAPKVPNLREDNVRQGFFTRDEIDRLVDHLPEPYATAVLFAFLTGWRLDEIRKLEWRNVDFTRGEIRIDVGKDKNRAGRVIPMTLELRSLLKHALALAEATKRKEEAATNVPHAKVSTLTPHVFVARTRKKIKGEWRDVIAPIGEFRKTWARAIYNAGLPCTVHLKTDRAGNAILGTQRDAKGKPLIARIEPHRTFHDIRRSFARDMDVKGIRRGAAMKIGGWKTESVYRRYNIVSDGDLRDAIDRIDELNGANLRGQLRKETRESE